MGHPPPRRLSGAGGRGGSGAVHVTVPSTAGKRRQSGIVLHRSSALTASECLRRDGIPVTNPGRTLVDLRPLRSPAEFNAAVRETEFLGPPIDAGVVRQGRGSSKAPRTRTELEGLFLSLCLRHRLPQPEVNVHVDRFEVDFLWRVHRLIVEVDGWESHRTRSAFEEDRRRDARLKLLGYEVLRFTWRQVKDEARTIAATIRTLLRRLGEFLRISPGKSPLRLCWPRDTRSEGSTDRGRRDCGGGRSGRLDRARRWGRRAGRERWR
jgi:very-short-patch-repair endonuclease